MLAASDALSLDRRLQLSVAQIHPLDEGGEVLGTAWLCGEDLALTAAHVVCDRREVLLRFEGGETATAAVHVSSELDVGLLEIAAGAALPPPLPMNDDLAARPGESWRAYGYPRGWPAGYAVSGRIVTLAAAAAGERVMTLTCDQGPQEKLKGLSGAPVFDSAGLVIGLLSHFPKQLHGMVHAVRLDDAWRALPRWRDRAGEWISAGPISSYLDLRQAEWERLTYQSAFRQRGPAPQLENVFISQRFRAPKPRSHRTKGAAVGASVGVELLLDHLAHDGRHVVVRGDPGTGKSVLLRWLAIRTAEKWRRRESRVEVPILIHASSLAKQSVDEAIAASDPLFAGPPPDALRWLLLIDGLDEVVDVDDRRRVLEQLKLRAARARSRAAPPLRMVLASRPLALLDEVPETEAQQFVLQRWKPAQVEAFARRWFPMPGRADRFLEALAAARMRELAATPALATVAAVVFERSVDDVLPTSRGPLYDRFIDLALDERDVSVSDRFMAECEELYRGAGREVGGRLWRAREQIATDIAVRIQEGALDLVGGDYVGAAIEIAHSAAALPRARPGSSAQAGQRELITDLLLTSGLFTPAPNDGLAFLHNTLREALVARAVAEPPPTDIDSAWRVIGRWTEARWREVVLLALARWSQADSDLRALLWIALRPIMESSHRGLHFVGTALGEGLQLERSAEQQVVEAVLKRVEEWSPCAEVFSDFRSPNPVDMLRNLSRRPHFFDAVVARLKEEQFCKSKIWALLELTVEVKNVAALQSLLQGSAVVADAAALLIARSGQLVNVLPRLVSLIKTASRPEYAVRIAEIIGEEAELGQLTQFLDDQDVPARARVGAVLKAYARCPDLAATALSRLLPSLELGLDSEVDVELAERLARSGVPFKLERARPETCAVILHAAVRAELWSPELIRAARRLAYGEQAGPAAVTRSLAALLDMEGRPDDLAQARRLSSDAELAWEHRLSLGGALAARGDGEALRAIAEDVSAPASERRRAAIGLTQAGWRAEGLAVLRELCGAQTEDCSEAAVALFELGETEFAAGVLVQEARRTRWALRSLMELGRSAEIAQVVADTSVERETRQFAIRCLGELGDVERLLALVRRGDLQSDLVIWAVREIQALGWHREAESIRKGVAEREELGGTTLEEVEAALVARRVRDPSIDAHQLANEAVACWDDHILTEFGALFQREDLRPEDALELWMAGRVPRPSFDALEARCVRAGVGVETLLKFASLAGREAAPRAVFRALARALQQFEDADPEALSEAIEAARTCLPILQAEHLPDHANYRIPFLGKMPRREGRITAAVAFVRDHSASAATRLQALLQWREDAPDDEAPMRTIVAILRAPDFMASLDSPASFEVALQACRDVMQRGGLEEVRDQVAAIGARAVAFADNLGSRLLRDAGVLLADHGAFDLARPLLDQILASKPASTLDRLVVAWTIAEHDRKAGLEALESLAIGETNLNGEVADPGARCDVLRALYDLGEYKEVIRLAPRIRESIADQDMKIFCENYWGRAKWALAPPANI